jgi:glycosyltransferase involved in cell wall biosynthesis
VVTRHGLVGPPYLLRRELKFAVASRFCDSVVAVCEEAKRNLLAAPFAARNRIIRVYNGVSAINNSGRTVVPKTGFTLLHVGRLSPIKDQESLLRAFALAKCNIPDLRLWIVGDGPLRSRLQALARELDVDSVTQFLGEQADVGPFYTAADLFVMSSLSEGLPMSLLEATAAGLPSIVTNVGGMAEVASLGGAACVVPVSNYKALADAIYQTAADSCGLTRSRVAARRCYERNFTAERMANNYTQLYQRSFDRR